MTTHTTLLKEIMDPAYVRGLPREVLPDFCEELRQKLIEIVSQTGGHIGVNLGIVELTVALYRVFDFLEDSLIWDIGHQIYIQKMLTGRLPMLREIRKNGGSPGYAFGPESGYDRVSSSHGGAALSLSLGVAISNRLAGRDALTVAVVGDGAFVEGSCQEALNHMAVEQGRLLLVLNDNEIALDLNFGGWHEYFKKFQPGGARTETLFTSFGIPYRGPVDGHDVLSLVGTFEDLKTSVTRPTLLHVKTLKAKGLETMAEKSPVRIHWNFPFDPKTGQNTETPKAPNYARASGEVIDRILAEDPKAVLVTPATLQNTGTYAAFCRHRDKSFDVSLAEQHALTLGGGFALQGMKPIVCFESTFLLRAYDQLVHDICINALPVLIVAARTGHTGLDHLTHHALLDLAYLRCVPNLRIIVSASQEHLVRVLREEFDRLAQPTLLLYPYGNALEDPEAPLALDSDPPVAVSPDARGMLISVGSQHRNAQQLRHLLAVEGIRFDHLAITQVAPLTDTAIRCITARPYLVTLEEGVLEGGLRSLALETLQDQGRQAQVLGVGFPKRYVEHGTRAYIYKKFGMDAESVLARMKEAWPELWQRSG